MPMSSCRQERLLKCQAFGCFDSCVEFCRSLSSFCNILAGRHLAVILKTELEGTNPQPQPGFLWRLEIMRACSVMAVPPPLLFPPHTFFFLSLLLNEAKNTWSRPFSCPLNCFLFLWGLLSCICCFKTGLLQRCVCTCCTADTWASHFYCMMW